jgi:hypothetical protein
MLKRNLMFIMSIMILISFVSAEDNLAHKVDTDLNFSITSNFATQCTLISIDTPTQVIPINKVVTDTGSFEFNILAGNYSELGTYCHNIICTDGTDSISGKECRDITSSGKTISLINIFAYAIAFIFFILIIFAFHHFTSKINYEQWHNSIIKKYEDRNIVKVIISSIFYNVLKNSFIWYYLFGLPIILLVTDIAYVFNVESMIYLLKIILGVYYFGFLIVGVYFFGYLQEWVMQIIDEIKSLDYGV